MLAQPRGALFVDDLILCLLKQPQGRTASAAANVAEATVQASSDQASVLGKAPLTQQASACEASCDTWTCHDNAQAGGRLRDCCRMLKGSVHTVSCMSAMS